MKCENCERMFDKEWKMKAHLRTHKLHSCGSCKKTFKNEDILEKYLKIAHEGLKTMPLQ